MYISFRLLHWLNWIDWIVVLAWLVRATTWLRAIRQAPDLTHAPASDSVSLPRLTVIVPARNEARSIAATLESLLESRGVSLEIIAVDDRSEDETGTIMDRIADRISRAAEHRGEDPAVEAPTLRVLHVADLPPGWLGKTHAMASAAQIAGGEWLLFTDGDILFHEDTLRRALGFAVRSQADHFVILPTLILKTWSESMMLSFFTVMTIWVMRPWRVESKREPVGVGAFNMIRRDVYERIGGWEALKMEIIEDFALGLRVNRLGYKQRVAYGRGLVSVRWAEGAQGVIANVAKNMFAFFHYRLEIVVGVLVLFLVLTLLPFLAVSTGLPAFAAMGVMLLALWLAYRGQGKYQPFSAWQMALFPVASVVTIYAICRSTAIVLWQGGVSWRGTFYPLAELRKRAGKNQQSSPA